MDFDAILELLKKKKGFRSNEELPGYFGMSRGGFYDVKSGRGGLKERTIRKIMDGTGLDAVTIQAAWEAEHAKDPKIRKSWKNFLSRAGLYLLLSPALLTEVITKHCILCKIARLQNDTNIRLNLA